MSLGEDQIKERERTSTDGIRPELYTAALKILEV